MRVLLSRYLLKYAQVYAYCDDIIKFSTQLRDSFGLRSGLGIKEVKWTGNGIFNEKIRILNYARWHVNKTPRSERN